MGGVYRIVRPDGTVEYSDVPGGPGQIDAVGRDGRVAERKAEEPYDHKQTEKLIGEARKRIPKVNDYLEYIEYLRNHRPFQLDRVLQQLRKEDPKTWLLLQKYPQFRPLRDTVLGVRAGEKHMGLGTALVPGGSITGSAEKWFETTVKDMMKRDRWGPYAEVLGAKASTLPQNKPTAYSNSRLGQYLKVEDARLSAAAKASAKEFEASRAALRASKATAFTRVGGPLVDIGVAALNPENAQHVGNLALDTKAKHLWRTGVLGDMEYLEAKQLQSQGKYVEMRKLMDDATNAYVRGTP